MWHRANDLWSLFVLFNGLNLKKNLRKGLLDPGEGKGCLWKKARARCKLDPTGSTLVVYWWQEGAAESYQGGELWGAPKYR